MSDRHATAGFRNAGWTAASLPRDVHVSVHPLATQDGAAVTGVLYATDSAKTVFCIMHPREFMAAHYLVPELLAGGHAVWTQTSRSVGSDVRLEHEVALLDVAAGMNLMREQFQTIVLVGNSGGASLYGFYNQQSLLAPQARLSRSPGGRPVDLASATMPVADGVVFVSPHPGQGQILLNCIDPAVIDEADPLRSDPALDFLDTRNGYGPGPRGARYSPEFVERFRAGQRARVERLDARAREMIETRLAARKRAKAGAEPSDRKLAAHNGIMTIWRTDADLRCWDLSLDPSERPLGSVWGKDPFTTNYGVPGFGRTCTPEAWLSTWSALSSKANLFETAASVEQPFLQVEFLGDNTAFPGDLTAIFDRVGATQKQRLRFSGDHHGRALQSTDVPGRAQAGEAIRNWAAECFRD